MKTRIFIMLALSAMIVMSCSKESLTEDNLIETSDLKMNQQSVDAKKPKPHAFKVKGFGTLEIIKESECSGLNQVEMVGQTVESSLGSFKTFARKCTNFNNKNYIKGMHVAGNGDELHFYSEESGENNNSNYNVYIYYGGTGLFEGASGKVQIFSVETYQTALNGTYESSGKGTLTY